MYKKKIRSSINSKFKCHGVFKQTGSYSYMYIHLHSIFVNLLQIALVVKLLVKHVRIHNYTDMFFGTTCYERPPVLSDQLS